MTHILKAKLIENSTCCLGFDTINDIHSAIQEIIQFFNLLKRVSISRKENGDLDQKSYIRKTITSFNNSNELDKIFLATCMINSINNRTKNLTLLVNDKIHTVIDVSFLSVLY